MKIVNPVIDELRRSADPYIIFDKGVYYSCYTDGDGVYISYCNCLNSLNKAKEIKVWNNTTGKPIFWYAPELHKIGDKWYIYGAPDGLPGFTVRTMAVLESETDNPLGPYEYKGMLKGLENRPAIDGTVFNHDGKMYMIWSNANLVIAEMSDPLTVTDERHILTRPDRSFEKVKGAIAEGPFVIKKDGRLHVIYSGSNSNCDDYCLCLLTFNGGNILDSSNWTKCNQPVFSKTDGIYGPGHCSVTTVENNGVTTDVLVYHANLVSGTGWNGRSVWLKPIKWENGYPIFGIPEKEIEI